MHWGPTPTPPQSPPRPHEPLPSNPKPCGTKPPNQAVENRYNGRRAVPCCRTAGPHSSPETQNKGTHTHTDLTVQDAPVIWSENKRATQAREARQKSAGAQHAPEPNQTIWRAGDPTETAQERGGAGDTEYSVHSGGEVPLRCPTVHLPPRTQPASQPASQRV